MSMQETIVVEKPNLAESDENMNESFDLVKELEQPEIKQSLTYLIRKLPDIQQSVESLDKIITFGTAVLQDSETMNSLENRFQTYPVDAEAIEAGIQLIGKLPMLLVQIEMLERITFFIKDVLNDEQSMEQINYSIGQLPFVKEGKEAFEIVREVKERVQKEQSEKVSLLTMMKWLKDPNVQRGLQFVNTALTILNEKQNN